MCSIIAYKGSKEAAPLLVKALKRLEYRGYDSVGIATFNNKIFIKKGVGRVDEVNQRLNLSEINGKIGIGHTRWATHGNITDYNAHPHKACNNIAIVHNGKIENYEQLKSILREHKFNSNTDSEIIAHLLEEHLKHKGLKDAIISTCKMLKGAYAFAAIINNILIGARKDEPLIIGIADDEYYLSSDILGFINYTDKAIFLDNNEIAIIDDGLKIYNLDGREVKKSITDIAWEFADIDKCNYAHYTLKEIYEQEHTIKNVFNTNYDLEEFANIMLDAKRLLLVASGSSYNASLLAKILFNKVGIDAEVIIASESQYYKELFNNSVVLAVSQSGETRDVLRAVDYAKANNCKVLSIVNVKSSSLARASDLSLSIKCGAEVGVAATKSFTAQLALFYRLADYISNLRLDVDISSTVRDVLSIKLDEIVDDISNVNDIYILGRSIHYPIALEGALKIKELAYIHAEGMAAGEFRHGPLALVDSNTVVIMINPNDETFDDTYSNIKEIKARDGIVIGISDKQLDYDYHIKIPSINNMLYPIIEAIPLQLLAYNLALKKNYNPDYPRNLAKSVTVD